MRGPQCRCQAQCGRFSAKESFNNLKESIINIKQSQAKETKETVKKLNKVYLENRKVGDQISSFFEIYLDESKLMIRSGRIKSNGITRTIQYSQAEKAENAFQQKIDQKLKQGFIICN